MRGSERQSAGELVVRLRAERGRARGACTGSRHAPGRRLFNVQNAAARVTRPGLLAAWHLAHCAPSSRRQGVVVSPPPDLPSASYILTTTAHGWTRLVRLCLWMIC